MKNLLILLSSSALLCSCGGLTNHPTGLVYANVSDPIAATNSSGSRTGVATATSYLGLVAVGFLHLRRQGPGRHQHGLQRGRQA